MTPPNDTHRQRRRPRRLDDPAETRRTNIHADDQCQRQHDHHRPATGATTSDRIRLRRASTSRWKTRLARTSNSRALIRATTSSSRRNRLGKPIRDRSKASRCTTIATITNRSRGFTDKNNNPAINGEMNVSYQWNFTCDPPFSVLPFDPIIKNGGNTGPITLNLAQTEFEPIAAGRIRACPPRLPFVVSVGVTGHRADSLPAGSTDSLRQRIHDVLQLVSDSARSLFERERDFSHPIRPASASYRQSPMAPTRSPPRSRSSSAGSCRSFSRSSAPSIARRSPITGRRESFDDLLGHASSVLELPGHGERLIDAYVMTGRATVAHCEALIAVWDGLPPRGRGGTGEVVQFAITRGTAVSICHSNPMPPAACCGARSILQC